MAWTSKLAIVACALIVIACSCAYYDLSGGSLNPTDKQLILVTTDSMDGDVTGFDVDSFPANTLVMVEHLSELDKKFIKIGDVISYESNHVLVQHRVIAVNQGSITVHGDNNHSTEVVSLESVNGKVVGTNWVIGHVIAFISGHFLIFLTFMFILAAVVAIYAVYSEPKPRREGAL